MKVFQIGFNKCGNAAIGRFFELHGLPTASWMKGELAKSLVADIEAGNRPLATWTAEYDVFVDMEYLQARGVVEGYRYFRELHDGYPDALFVLNTTPNVDGWIRRRAAHGEGSYLEGYRRYYGYDTAERVIARWREEWVLHHDAVLRHFSGEKAQRLFVWNIDAPDFDELQSKVPFPVVPRHWRPLGPRGRVRQPPWPESSPPGLAEALETRFRQTSQGRIPPMISTDRLYDIAKIRALQRWSGRPYPDFPVVPFAEACVDSHVVQRRGVIDVPKPEGVAHYMFRRDEFHRSQLDLFHLKDVYLSYDVRNNGRPEYYLFTAKRELINGLFFGARPFFDEPSGEVSEPSVFIDDPFTKENICHFVFDKFPRAFLAEERYGRRRAVYFNGFDYAKSVCALCDVDTLALSPTLKGTVRLKDAVFVSDTFMMLRHPAQLGAPKHLAALELLRSRIPRASRDDAPTKVFLERAANVPRNIRNMDDVRAVAERFGYWVGDPATMAPIEQLAMFASVTSLAGVHGAGLTGLAFQPVGSSVVELLPPLCATAAYWIMCHQMGRTYRPLACLDPDYGAADPSTITHDVAHNRRDVVVPTTELERVFSELLETR